MWLIVGSFNASRSTLRSGSDKVCQIRETPHDETFGGRSAFMSSSNPIFAPLRVNVRSVFRPENGGDGFTFSGLYPVTDCVADDASEQADSGFAGDCVECHKDSETDHAD